MTKGRGYWAKDGELIDLGTTRSHISYVIENAERFGFAREELVAVYARHGELIGFEGKARAEIMREALRRGWIRVRENKREGKWILEVDSLANRKKEAEFVLASLFYANVVICEDLAVISGVEDGESESFTGLEYAELEWDISLDCLADDAL